MLRQLEAAQKLQDDVCNLYRNSEFNVARDFCNYGALQINHESLVVDLLKRIFDDEFDNIEYFIYELDFGKRYVPGMIISDGENIDLSTADKLYDYLIKNMQLQE